MTATLETMIGAPTIRAPMTIEAVHAFLFREARALDDRQWDAWLACYAPEAVFWMPAWDDDDELVEDPQRDISLIYYGHKGGLEDRVFRIRTERSSATSLPEPRTTHNISNVEVMAYRNDALDLRFNWLTMSYRYKTITTYFGTSYYTLATAGPAPLITHKKVVLKNDCINHVIDVYHI